MHVLKPSAQQAIKYHEGTANYSTVAINLAGCLAFGALFFVDRKAADDRVSRREKVGLPADGAMRFIADCA